MSGHFGDLSAEQQKAFDAFKANVEMKELDTTSDAVPSNLDDYYYLRFLRARDFDLAKSWTMFENHLKWYEAEKIGTILKNPPAKYRELYRKAVPHAHHGVDKQGRPVYYQKTGKAQVETLSKFVPTYDMLRVHLWDMEHLQNVLFKEASEREGKRVETVVNILDLTGWKLAHRGLIPGLAAITRVDEDNYPETLGASIIINAPSVFPMIWNLVKGFLDPVVASKVEVLGSDYKAVLLEKYFDADQLPEEYGGESKFEVPTWDQSETLAKLREDEARLGLIDETILAGKKFVKTIPVDATEGEKSVSWYFRTALKNINFSVTLTTDDNKKVALVPSTKVESQVAFVTDSATIPAGVKGTVSFLWDNSFSWAASKQLSYNVWGTDDEMPALDLYLY